MALHIRIIFYFIITISLCIQSTGVAAQDHNLKKANKLYESLTYNEAIDYYKLSIHNEDSAKAIIKIADCYRLINNQKEAEFWYARVVELKEREPIHLFYYAKALMSSEKYETAKKWFLQYADLNPSDSRGKQFAESCDLVDELKKNAGNYNITILPFNTSKSHFAPTYYKNGILFVAEQKDLLIKRKIKGQGDAFLDLYFANKGESGEWSDPKPLAGEIRTKFHEGPATLNKAGNVIYFTKNSSKNSSDGTKKLRIFKAQLNDGKWKNIEELSFTSDDYSIAQPSLSADESQLFYVSDMAGKNQGTDIYVSYRKGKSWSEPQNLGPIVNTNGNEMFPFIHPDGTLYFASDGHGGLGGLDIFSAKLINGTWADVQNIGYPINSSYDDFGIIMNYAYNSGYFSSNRSDGLGGDDIYFVDILNNEELNSSQNIISFSGEIRLENKKPAAGIEVTLLNKDNKIVATTTTDEIGAFNFEKLPANLKYIVEVNEADDTKLYIEVSVTDVNGIPESYVQTRDERGLFVFEKLPTTKDLLTFMGVEDTELNIEAGNVGIVGKVVADENYKIEEGINVVLMDENGNILEQTIADNNGVFQFKNLPTNKNYVIKIDETDDTGLNLELFMVDEHGISKNYVKTKDETGSFKFEKLPATKDLLSFMGAEDTELNIDKDHIGIVGKIADQETDKNKEGIKIVLLDENGEILDETTTDSEGMFQFKNLPSQKNYLIKIDESDDSGLNIDMFVADEFGNAVKFAETKEEDGFYRFQKLSAYKDHIALLEAKDTKLAAFFMEEKIKFENLKFDYDNFFIKTKEQKILTELVSYLNNNPNINIQVSSHTDSVGTDQYNLKLSKKRSDVVMEYLLNNGINKNRITIMYYGEHNPIAPNTNPDGSDNPEGRQKNRRTEFKLIQESKKEVLSF